MLETNCQCRGVRVVLIEAAQTLIKSFDIVLYHADHAAATVSIYVSTASSCSIC